MTRKSRILQPPEDHFMPAASHNGIPGPVSRTFQDSFPVMGDGYPIRHRSEHTGVSRIIHKPALYFQQVIHIQLQDIPGILQTGQLQKSIRHRRCCFFIPDTLIGSACHHHLAAAGFHFRLQQKRPQGFRSGGFPEYGNTGNVPAEGSDIIPDPAQGRQLIQRSDISCMPERFSQNFSQIQIAQHSQAVIYGYINKTVIPYHLCPASVPVAAVLECTSVYVYRYRQFFPLL